MSSMSRTSMLRYFCAEVQDLAVLEMVDEVVHELFGRDVEDLRAAGSCWRAKWPMAFMRWVLPRPGPAVDVERVVGLGRVLGHGQRGGVGELVAGADDEVLEGVVRIEVGIEERPVLRPALVRRAAHERDGRVVEDVLDLAGIAEQGLGALVDQAGIVEGQPVAEVGVRDLDVETSFSWPMKMVGSNQVSKLF